MLNLVDVHFLMIALAGTVFTFEYTIQLHDGGSDLRLDDGPDEKL